MTPRVPGGPDIKLRLPVDIKLALPARLLTVPWVSQGTTWLEFDICTLFLDSMIHYFHQCYLVYHCIRLGLLCDVLRLALILMTKRYQN